MAKKTVKRTAPKTAKRKVTRSKSKVSKPKRKIREVTSYRVIKYA